MKYTLEICVDSLASAIEAEAGGASRVELCENLVIGGTTPSPSFFRQVRQAISLPIHVLIRPRFGDFLYSKQEIRCMKQEIHDLAEAGAEVFVIGALTKDGNLNEVALQDLMRGAPQARFVLHRAFDMSRDLEYSMQQAIRLGFMAVLTSGGQGDAYTGRDSIRELVENAGDAIDIMVGAGVNTQNLEALVQTTSAKIYHMSAKKVIESEMQYRNPQVFMGLPSISEYSIYLTDRQEVKLARDILKKLDRS